MALINVAPLPGALIASALSVTLSGVLIASGSLREHR
jgi:hypothetical protein